MAHNSLWPLSSALYSYFPEANVGGFSRVDTTVEFYLRIQSLLKNHFKILDYGAGRGRAFHEDSCAMRRELRRMKGKVDCVVGVDVDDAVHQNPSLDEAYVVKIAPDGAFELPFADASFDLVFSDWTFEHITNPLAAAAELNRVLKQGGWLCIRTPNRWGYIALGSRLVPERFHDMILRRIQPKRKTSDIFPTTYALCSPPALKKHFSTDEYEHNVYHVHGEPWYAGNSFIAWGGMLLLFRALPETLRPILLGFLRKTGHTTQSWEDARISTGSDRGCILDHEHRVDC
jgi:SAM-dependent methyltransferase